MKAMLIFIETNFFLKNENANNKKTKNVIFQIHQYPIFYFITIFKI
jgi:hypothetical protein